MIIISKKQTIVYNKNMPYFLAENAALKWLETPSVYQLNHDELYELDDTSFAFFKMCLSETGGTTKDSAFVDYCLEEGILIPDKASARHPPVIRAPEPSLRYLELQVTNACNLRCKHCYIDGGPARELSVEQVRGVLEEFEEMQGLRVMITGGEPLLHSEFPAINELLSDVAVRATLFTNGLLLTDRVLKDLNVHEIQISIDGLEHAHDSIRGRGAYKQATEALQRSLDAGFDTSIATMVHPGNRGDFETMEQMFKHMGIKDWTVDIPCETGRLKSNREFYLTPEEGGTYLAYGYGGGLHSTGAGYACGLHLMAVMPDGRTAKCTFYGDEAAGTIDEGLRACWSRIRPLKLGTLPCDCDYREVCRGGCRYRAELLDGAGGKDLYRCALYGIV